MGSIWRPTLLRIARRSLVVFIAFSLVCCRLAGRYDPGYLVFTNKVDNTFQLCIQRHANGNRSSFVAGGCVFQQKKAIDENFTRLLKRNAML